MKLGPLQELMARLSMDIQSHHLTKLKFSCSDLSEVQKQSVQSPIRLLVVLRKKSTSNEHFLAMLERLFEGVDDFEEFAKTVREFRSHHPNLNLIPSSPTARPSLPNGALGFKPSRDQKVKFKKMLVKISDSINWIHLEVMLSLSPVPDNLKEYVKAGFQLFNELQRHGCISENDTELLDHFFSLLSLETPVTILRDYQRQFPQQIFDDPPPSAPLYRSHSHGSSPSSLALSSERPSSLGAAQHPSGAQSLPHGSTYSRLSSYPPSVSPSSLYSVIPGPSPSPPVYPRPSRSAAHSVPVFLRTVQPSTTVTPPSHPKRPIQASSPTPLSGDDQSTIVTPPSHPKRPIQASSPTPLSGDDLSTGLLEPVVRRKRPSTESFSHDPREQPPPSKSIHTRTEEQRLTLGGQLHVACPTIATSTVTSTAAQSQLTTFAGSSCQPSMNISYASSWSARSGGFCTPPIPRENTGEQVLVHGMDTNLLRPQTNEHPVQESSPLGQPTTQSHSPSKMVTRNRSTLHPPPLVQKKHVLSSREAQRIQYGNSEAPPSINYPMTEQSLDPQAPSLAPFRRPPESTPHQHVLSTVAEESRTPEGYSSMAGRLTSNLVYPGHPAYDSLGSVYGGSSLASQGLSSYGSQLPGTLTLLSGLSSEGGSVGPGSTASQQSTESCYRQREGERRAMVQSSERTERRTMPAAEEYPREAEEEEPKGEEEEGEREMLSSRPSFLGRVVSGVTGFLGSWTGLRRGSTDQEEEEEKAREREKNNEDKEHSDDEESYESCDED